LVEGLAVDGLGGEQVVHGSMLVGDSILLAFFLALFEVVLVQKGVLLRSSQEGSVLLKSFCLGLMHRGGFDL